MRTLMTLALLCVSGALAVTALAGAGHTAKAKPAKFSAALNVGQEVPHPKGTKAGASGRFTATVTGTTMKWTLTFAHLSGPATAAHIHNGLKGKAGPIVITLCTPCTSPASGTTTGEVTASAVTAMTAGKYYVNVHTAKNPNGEIRGQITHATM